MVRQGKSGRKSTNFSVIIQVFSNGSVIMIKDKKVLQIVLRGPAVVTRLHLLHGGKSLRKDVYHVYFKRNLRKPAER